MKTKQIVEILTAEETYARLKYGICESCLSNTGERDHECPYKAEINDDYETQCNCCGVCSDSCAADV